MSEPLDLNQLAQKIKQWGLELGFQQVGITDTDLSESEPKLQAWLDKQYHGEMDWMARHGMYTYGVFLHCMVRHVRAPRSQSVSAKN